MALNENSMDVARVLGPVLFAIGMGFHWLMFPYSTEAVQDLAIWSDEKGWYWINYVLYFLFEWSSSLMRHIAFFIVEVIFVLLAIKSVLWVITFLKGDPKAKNNAEDKPKLTFKARARKFVLYLIGIVVLLIGLVAGAHYADTVLLQNSGAIEDKLRTMVKNEETGEVTISYMLGDPVIITNRKSDGGNYTLTVEVTRERTCLDVYSALLYRFDLYDRFMRVKSMKAGERIYPDISGMKRGERPDREERKAWCKSKAGQSILFEAVYRPYFPN